MKPFRAGALIAAVATVAFLVTEFAAGRLPPTSDNAADIRIALLHCVIIGYLYASSRFTIDRTRRTVRELRPLMAWDEQEFNAQLARVGHYSSRAITIAVLLGLSVSVMGPFLTSGQLDQSWLPRSWSIEVAWHRALGLLVGPAAGFLGLVLLQESMRLSRLSRSLRRVNLLNIPQLSPFTDQALSNALIVVGQQSLMAFFAFDQGITLLLAFATFWNISIVVLVLFAPLNGVRLRIQETKERELVWCARRIAQARNALAAGGSGTPDMANLVAYRRLIEDVREWPIDIGTYARLAAFVVLPLLSWLVGRIVDAVLNRVVG